MRKARAVACGPVEPRRRYVEAAIAVAAVVLVAVLAHAGLIAPVVARAVFAVAAVALVFEVRRRAQALVMALAARKGAVPEHTPRR